jgi:Arc/MetJ family transcription regulator
MRATLDLDKKLLEEAQEFTGIREKAALLRAALKALMAEEAARRLAALGGSMPGIKRIPRRRAKLVRSGDSR